MSDKSKTESELEALFGKDALDYFMVMDDLYGELDLTEAISAGDLEGAKHIILMMQHHYPPHPEAADRVTDPAVN